MIDRDFTSGLPEELTLNPGETFVVTRQELVTRNVSLESPNENSLWAFFKKLAEEPSIEGVALSKMKYGGVYPDWFVRGDDDAGRRALRVTGESYKLLEAGVGDRAGYGPFWHMGSKSFEEIEQKFRTRWGESRNILGMPMPPRDSEMELMVIIRFI